MKQLPNLIPKLSRQQMIFALAAALSGVVLFCLVRFVFQPYDPVHYHANFAVFINGERREFKGPQFYQEVASCSAKDNSQGRVHMHDNIGHVVHVHDKLVTWANFFDILGWSLQEKALFDGTKSYVDGQGGELRFMINGKPALSVANEVIKSEDVLLISFGNEDPAVLTHQYSQIGKDAHEYNLRKDPSACTGPEEQSLAERLQRSLWY